MKRFASLFMPVALLLMSLNANAADAKQGENEEEWISLPAGGRPAYMGIHGGTMPVSLLVVGNGEALLTFVGRTGNDFLEALKATNLALPRLLNATRANSSLPNIHASSLFAGNSTASLPVIAIAGERLAGQLDRLQPFGLSDEPLRIEGKILKPASAPKIKNYRLSFLPAFLKPKR